MTERITSRARQDELQHLQTDGSKLNVQFFNVVNANTRMTA